jgi:hypothetical protein
MNEMFLAPQSGGSCSLSDEIISALSGHPERLGVVGRHRNGAYFVRVWDSQARPNDPARNCADLRGTADGWEWMRQGPQREG